MTSVSTSPSSTPFPPRALTVGVELQMALFDGATAESVIDILKAAGLRADDISSKKANPAGSDAVDASGEGDILAGSDVGGAPEADPTGHWRVREDRFIFSKAALIKQAAPVSPTELPAGFPLQEPKQSSFIQSAIPIFHHAFGANASSDDPNEQPPIIDGPAFGVNILSPMFEDDQGPKTDEWQFRVHALAAAIKASKHRAEVNTSTSFHVRIGAGGPPEGFTFEEAKKIAALYLAYEKRIDGLHPNHRRNDPQARSNLMKSLIGREVDEQNDTHPVLATRTLTELVNGICTPEHGIDCEIGEINEITNTECYKLNLAGLLTKEQVVEWRQHSGTIDPNQVCRWANFTLAFVRKALTISEEDLRRLQVDDEASIFDDALLRKAYYGTDFPQASTPGTPGRCVIA